MYELFLDLQYLQHGVGWSVRHSFRQREAFVTEAFTNACCRGRDWVQTFSAHAYDASSPISALRVYLSAGTHLVPSVVCVAASIFWVFGLLFHFDVILTYST